MVETRLVNPLPLRLGILGHIEDTTITDSYTPATRYARLLDQLQASSLHAHGFEYPHGALFRHGAEELRPLAEQQDLWTHFLWSAILAAEPRPGNHTYLVHANAAIHARMAHTAGIAGCRTYVLHPPLLTNCDLDVYAQEVGILRDEATKAGPVLGIVTPPSARYHLDDPAELSDFARDHGLALVVHAGNVAAAGHLQLTQDDWTAFLRGVAAPGLFCYSAQSFHNGEWRGLASYRGDATAEPRLLPFLRAIQKRRCRDDSLLMQGTRNEIEVLEVFNVIAAENGLDAHALLGQRESAYPHSSLGRLR